MLKDNCGDSISFLFSSSPFLNRLVDGCGGGGFFFPPPPPPLSSHPPTSRGAPALIRRNSPLSSPPKEETTSTSSSSFEGAESESRIPDMVIIAIFFQTALNVIKLAFFSFIPPHSRRRPLRGCWPRSSGSRRSSGGGVAAGAAEGAAASPTTPRERTRSTPGSSGGRTGGRRGGQSLANMTLTGATSVINRDFTVLGTMVVMRTTFHLANMTISVADFVPALRWWTRVCSGNP